MSADPSAEECTNCGSYGAKLKCGAAQWLCKAADQGQVEAQYRPGLHFAVPQHFTEATRWAEKAAGQGHGNAQRLLAVLAELSRITEGAPGDL